MLNLFISGFFVELIENRPIVEYALKIIPIFVSL